MQGTKEFGWPTLLAPLVWRDAPISLFEPLRIDQNGRIRGLVDGPREEKHPLHPIPLFRGYVTFTSLVFPWVRLLSILYGDIVNSCWQGHQTRITTFTRTSTEEEGLRLDGL